jgi:hypothetical protein
MCVNYIEMPERCPTGKRRSKKTGNCEPYVKRVKTFKSSIKLKNFYHKKVKQLKMNNTVNLDKYCISPDELAKTYDTEDILDDDETTIIGILDGIYNGKNSDIRTMKLPLDRYNFHLSAEFATQSDDKLGMYWVIKIDKKIAVLHKQDKYLNVTCENIGYADESAPIMIGMIIGLAVSNNAISNASKELPYYNK